MVPAVVAARESRAPSMRRAPPPLPPAAAAAAAAVFCRPCALFAVPLVGASGRGGYPIFPRPAFSLMGLAPHCTILMSTLEAAPAPPPPPPAAAAAARAIARGCPGASSPARSSPLMPRVGGGWEATMSGGSFMAPPTLVGGMQGARPGVLMFHAAPPRAALPGRERGRRATAMESAGPQ